MNELFSQNKNSISVDKTAIEVVENQKQEYKLIDSFLRTPGLGLYGYDLKKDEIYLVEEKTIDVFNWNNSESTAKYEASVDSRHIFFEALNMKSAKKRVQKWKNGEKKLDNLKYNKESLPLYT